MGAVCPASARAAVGFLAPHRKDSRGLRPFSAFRGPLFPPEAPGSLHSRTHKPDASPQPSRRPPARPPQPSEAAIGRRRRGGVGRRLRPRLPLALAPLRLAVGSTSHGLGRPARQGRPEAGPAPPASRPRPLRSQVSSAGRSASFAQPVPELSERSERQLSPGGRGLVVLSRRCLPEPIRPARLGREPSLLRGNLGFRTRSRGVALRSGLGDQGECSARRLAAPLGAVPRAGGLDASWGASARLPEGGRCGEPGLGGMDSSPDSRLLNFLFQSVATARDANLRARELGVWSGPPWAAQGCGPWLSAAAARPLGRPLRRGSSMAYARVPGN